jgi:nucleoside-diphosphate-sugar epimerase
MELDSRVVLVTGGAGFLGINLIKRIQSLFGTIVIVDNFITSQKEKLSLFIKLQGLQNKVKVYDLDICQETTMQQIKQDIPKIDQIYHLASLASPPYYKRYPLETLDVGYLGMKNVLDLCLHYEAKMLYTSTSEVYGDALEHPQTEAYYGNVNPYGERSSYDESKRIGESLIYSYRKLYPQIKTRIVRIFNTYGPYMCLGDGRIVTEIMRCMIMGSPLTIYGDGTQTRSLSYVDDTIEMILRVMEGNYSKPVNVGNDVEVSINELVEVAKTVYKQKFNKEPCLEVVYKTIDHDDPKVRKPCLVRNRIVTNYTSQVSLQDGLAQTLDYFLDLADS